MRSNTQRLRNLLIQYFQAIASGENSFQCIKQAIFLQQNFNPLRLFDMIAKGAQFQTFQDWKRYLIDSNISFQQQELIELFKHEKFEKKISLNSFLEAIMPYSPEVLRDYKKRYLTSVQIQNLDPQCQIMFKELMRFQVTFFKSLIKIKDQISSLASITDIITLVKQDLINKSVQKSNVRKAVKFKQTFDTADYEIGYNQLRRFLQYFTQNKKGNIQYDILQITRFFKGQNPFSHLDAIERRLFKSRARNQRQKSSSPKKIRSKSSQGLHSRGKIITNNITQENLSQNKRDYKNYKQQLFKQMQSYKQNYENKFKSDKKPLNNFFRTNNQYGQVNNEQKNIRNIRYKRDLKGIKGDYILQLFQEIVTKQKVIQKLRKHLANDNTFNLINLYKLIDYNNRGYVNSKTIEQFIGGSNIDCKQLVSYYARQKQKLRFQDFCMIYRPLSKKLNDLLDQRPEHKIPNPFKKDTMKSILEVLTYSSELFNRINALKQSINDKGINLKNLFRYVDLQEKGYIEAADIKDLLSQKNITCESKDLKCLMKIFKKRIEQKIIFEDFEQFINL